MKKIILFISFLFLMGISAYTVYAQDTEIQTTTYLTNTGSETTTNTGKIYYYYEYQDLISQIYADVYADVYQDVYNQIISDIDAEFYDAIYAEVEAKAAELLLKSELSLYVDDFQQMIYDVVDIADDSVLGIVNYLGSEVQAVGSGVVYRYDSTSNRYYIITNEHVIAEGNNFAVAFSDGTQYVATLLGYDIEVDIAILSFSAPDKTNIQVSTLGSSADLTKGTVVVAAGNPQGFSFFGSVTLGIVSGINRKVDSNQYIDYIQHDSAINPGNSGGPIYNLSGEVVGINVSKYADTNIEGMGFAIPIDLVKRIITRIETGTLTVNTIMPRLGATYYDVATFYKDGQVSLSNLTLNGVLRTDKVTLTLPNGIDSGFIIIDIQNNSTLSITEIKSGDVIYRIDNFYITNQSDYYQYVYNNYEAGDTINVYYYSLDHNSLEYNSLSSSVQVTFK
jgi:serine protease Do